MTQEQGRITAQQLPDVLARFDVHDRKPQPTDFAELASAINEYQTGIADKVTKGSQFSEDLLAVPGTNYGDRTKVVIRGISVSSLAENNFKRFPFRKLIEEGFLSMDDQVEVGLVPRRFDIIGPKASVRAVSKLFRFQFFAYDGKRDFKMVDKDNPTEGALAVSEVLMAIDKEVDKKFQAAQQTP